MVPYRRNADMPLLPYERQLIEALGCTEDEYREFVQQAERRAYVRPAGYEHIPDIRMDPVSIIVSLVVGVALSAASYLLTPKPKLASSGRSPRQRQLAGIDGASSYSPTQGFESIQELASYGNVVPIAFTKREEHPEGYNTGGLLISPAMVWSRMKSFGGFQVLEMVAVVGQGTVAQPDRAGIFLGNNAIDAIFDDQFQFFWNTGGSSSSRLKGANLIYGSLSSPQPPGSSSDGFICPTKNGTEDTGFSGAFTASNQTRFGVSFGIPNGTPYRPNWEIVSVLKSQDDDAQRQQVTNQRKFVDPYLRNSEQFGGGQSSSSLLDSGMPGIGRNYARHVGIVSHNGYVLPDPAVGTSEYNTTKWIGAFKTERSVQKGDTIEIYVGYGRQDVKPFEAFGSDSTPVRLDDVRSATDAEAVKFDRAFSKGAIFMIGRSVWQVTERPAEPYVPGGAYSTIRLKCIESWSVAQNKIGLIAKKVLLQPGSLPYGVDIEEVYYPILKVDFGSIRNTRPCDVTELGIKSQVWVQFNGITNFNSVPSPNELARFNRKDIQVREGKNTSYGRRTSFFALDARPANSEPYKNATENDGFTNLTLFAITGSAPQDIFSFIRIRHPSEGMFEYRLRPFPSVVFGEQTQGTQSIFELDGSSPYQEESVSTYLGIFTVGGRGRYIQPQDYWTHPQMAAKPEELNNLIYGEMLPTPFVTIAGTVEFLGAVNASTGAPIEWFTLSNIMAAASGVDPSYIGQVHVFSTWSYTKEAPTRTVTMRVTLRCFYRLQAGLGKTLWWEIISTSIAAITGNWPNGSLFTKNATSTAGTPFDFKYRLNSASVYTPYDTPKSVTRVWEYYSGIAEVSHYGDLIAHSCDNGPEHEVVYVNESLSEDLPVTYKGCAMAGLKLQSSNNFNSLDQLRCYIKTGLAVQRLTDGGTGASNLFTDLAWYLATNLDTGAGALIDESLIDRDQLAATGAYLRANKLFFDDVIAEPINLRSWLAEKASSMLCFIAIKNGKLSINPALPTNSSNVIANVAPRISAMFTDGNIIDGSLSVEWLELEERKMFQAAVIYRYTPLNELPQQETVIVRYAGSGAAELPIEEFSLPHVTSSDHAIKAAKYFLALRKHITHTITFQTLPYGLSLAPGEFIMVAVEQSPYSPANNGIVRDDGTVVSVEPLADGSYSVFCWERSQTTISEGTLQISNGIATSLRNTVFSVKNSQVTNQVYQVEAIDVNEDGIVSIKASSFPVDSQQRSLIAADVASSSTFEVIGGGIN
jgi:hypothetical protein